MESNPSREALEEQVRAIAEAGNIYKKPGQPRLLVIHFSEEGWAYGHVHTPGQHWVSFAQFLRIPVVLLEEWVATGVIEPATMEELELP